MGGDFGPPVVVPAVLAALQEFPELAVLLVGNADILSTELKKQRVPDHPRIEICHAEQSVAMDESPTSALRNKKKSSMRLALNYVKDGIAEACVSAGNTGALMVIGRYVLKTVPGIDRPAIITQLPTIDGHTHVLDLGANVDCTADHLVQFAVMGSVLAQAESKIASPKVGLLNIGEEDIKGNEQVKSAAAKLAELKQINYIGFVEGDDIYKGTADVIVCDGFVGNIALKTSEGLAKMIGKTMKESFYASLWGRFVGLLAMPILKDVKKRLDPRNYNGACFIGLGKPVIKSHGGADVYAFTNAIRHAVYQVKNQVPQQIHSQVSSIMQEYQT